MAAVIAAIDVRRPTERGTMSLGKTTSSRRGTRGMRLSEVSAGPSLAPCGAGSGWGVFCAMVLDLCPGIGDGGFPGLGRGDAALEGPRADQARDLVFVQDFFLQQGIGQRVQL